MEQQIAVSNLTRNAFATAFRHLLGICFGTGLLIRFVIVIVLAIHYKEDFEFLKKTDFVGQKIILWIIVSLLSTVLEFGLSVFSIVTAKLKKRNLEAWAKRSAGMVIFGIFYNAIHIQIYLHSLELELLTYINCTITLQAVNIVSAALLEASGFFLEDTENQPQLTATGATQRPATQLQDVAAHSKLQSGGKRREIVSWETVQPNESVKVNNQVYTREKVQAVIRAYESKLKNGVGDPNTNSDGLYFYLQVMDLINGKVNFDEIAAFRQPILNGNHFNQ